MVKGNTCSRNFTAKEIDHDKMKVLVIDGQVIGNSLLLLYYFVLFLLEYSYLKIQPMPLKTFNNNIDILSIK